MADLQVEAPKLLISPLIMRPFRSFISPIVVLGALFILSAGPFGCGGGGVTGTDNQLSGQWVAEKLNANGERVLLTFNAEATNLGNGITSKADHNVQVTAIRPEGDTYVADQGSYLIDGNNVTFRLNSIGTFAAPFTVSPTQITLKTEVYLKVQGSLNGPQVGGQIQISQAVADESVTVGSAPALRSSGPTFVPGEILIKSEGLSSQSALSLASPGVDEENEAPYQIMKVNVEEASALSVNDPETSLSEWVGQKTDYLNRLSQATVDEVERLRSEGVEASLNVILKTQSLASPNDSLLGDQWNLELLNMTDAWSEVTPTKEVVVAVIDTGIVDHPDLAGHVLTQYGYDFVHHAIEGIADLSLDGDGPDSDPTDPGDHQDMGLPGGSSWHGTHIAGIIAAGIDNGTGIAGIGTSVKILPLRAMGFDGNGTVHDVAQAIRYAAKLPNIAECTPFTALETGAQSGSYTYNAGTWTCHIDPNRPKADIINLSLGAPMDALSATPLTDAINQAYAAGVLVVAAAGNQAKGPGWCVNAKGQYEQNSSCDFYPAANPNVLSITAVYPSLAFASGYSNYGDTANNHQFLAAPGGSSASGILSTVNPAILGGYGELMGTSQAAAHVTGVAALILSEGHVTTPAEVRAALQSSAIDMGDPGRDRYYGYGLLNACGAIMVSRGATGSGASQLRLSTDSLDFGPLGAQGSVILSHTCGGSSIAVTNATKPSDAAWLTATLNRGTTPAQLSLAANRQGLAPGNYSTIVTIDTPAGSKTVKVSMTVGTAATSSGTEIDNFRGEVEKFLSGSSKYRNTLNLGEMIVLLVDAESGESKYYTKTDYSANYNFQFGGIKPGKYYLLAGIDQNLDGTICKSGEMETCVRYPDRTNPQPIVVTDTTKKNDLVLAY